jgi:uncharacterized membrane protein
MRRRPPEASHVENNMNYGSGMMGGYGIWPIVGVLVIVFLVIAIMKMLNKK